MAEIVTPMSTAMKARAKAAAEEHRPRIVLSAAVAEVVRDDVIVTPNQDAVYGPDPDWVANFTPREYRAMVRNGSNDAELRGEGWFEAETAHANASRPASDTPVRLP